MAPFGFIVFEDVTTKTIIVDETKLGQFNNKTVISGDDITPETSDADADVSPPPEKKRKVEVRVANPCHLYVIPTNNMTSAYTGCAVPGIAPHGR